MGSTVKASPQGLEIVKQATARKGWRKTSPALLDAACVSAATLKRFWRSIPISQDSFQAICYAVGVSAAQVSELNISTLKTPPISSKNKAQTVKIEAGAASPTQERESRDNLRRSLRAQLLASIRILAISGLTGIGKTKLAHQIASDLEEDYSIIHLTCDSVAPLTLASVVHAISKCACLDNFTFNLSELSDRLFSQKYLFIIDNFEHLLCSSTPDQGQLQSDIWTKFFQSILNAPSCNSRFILTTQDTPNTLGYISNLPSQTNSKPCWKICALSGLTPTEQINLFQNTLQNISLNNPQLETILQIGKAYAGHPLALQSVADNIAQNHSNPLDYWSDRTTNNLHNHTSQLQTHIQPRLTQTVTRLNVQRPDAFALLCASSHYPQPMTSLQWTQIGQTQNLAPNRCRELLNALQDRAFLIPSIHQNQLHFHAHPLISSLMRTQIHVRTTSTSSPSTQSARTKT